METMKTLASAPPSSEDEYYVRTTITYGHRKGSQRLFLVPKETTLSDPSLILALTFHADAKKCTLGRSSRRIPVSVCGQKHWSTVAIRSVIDEKNVTLGDLVAAAYPGTLIRVSLCVCESTDQPEANVAHDLELLGRAKADLKKGKLSFISGINVTKAGTKVYTVEAQSRAGTWRAEDLVVSSRRGSMGVNSASGRSLVLSKTLGRSNRYEL
ncbi:hypothetical protein MMC32_003110 [Xylographa parallela]|nr:hypothetical protein [Xylographa parallela]